jgi:hypothetical protein
MIIRFDLMFFLLMKLKIFNLPIRYELREYIRQKRTNKF